MSRYLGTFLVGGMLAVVSWFVIGAICHTRAENVLAFSSSEDGIALDPAFAKSEPSAFGEFESSKTATAAPDARREDDSSLPPALLEHEAHQAKAPVLPPLQRVTVEPDRPFIRDREGRFRLHWDALAATDLSGGFPPKVRRNLEEASEHDVSLTGFMTPFDQVGRASRFLLLELPVGCFFCQAPSATGIVLVELAPGSSVELTDNLVRVRGKLVINQSDPEDFLFILRDAKVSLAD